MNKKQQVKDLLRLLEIEDYIDKDIKNDDLVQDILEDDLDTVELKKKKKNKWIGHKEVRITLI